ncbi:MAG: biopolymer transporter ExbD [Planctomycetes bacterium]|nr:biopolymer transporter ExbD [Planctomycetota bacterium]
MIDLSALRRRGRGQPEVIILSLIDIMMVLLIFLLSTASSVRETGLELERPYAETGAQLDPEAVLLGVGAEGELSLEGRRVDRLSLRGVLEERLARRPDLGVVLVADRRTPAGLLVEVMDQARLAGARRVALAARKEAP